MTPPLHRREWFRDAYIRCAALIAAGVMRQMTPPDSVSVIETQLERAYRNGYRDGRKSARDGGSK